jgi:hypothetical protein
MPAPSRRRSDTGGKPWHGDDRGVSDLIAFVLMFSIIISGVALVSGNAFDSLTELSDREQIENSERGMKSAAVTIDDIHRQGDTQRSFSLALGGGSIAYNESEIEVSSPDDATFGRTYDVNAIEHRFDRSPEDVTVAYEGGAVFRAPSGRVRYQPSIACDDNLAIVSFARLEADNFAISEGEKPRTVLDPRSVSGEAPVADLGRSLIFSAEVEKRQRNVTSFDGSGGTGTISLNVSASANPTEWGQYFERSESEWTEDSNSVYKCENVDDAVVRVTTIELQILG